MRFLSFLLCWLWAGSALYGQDFLKHQLESDRVSNARDEKDAMLRQVFAEKGLSYPSNKLLIRVFKSESVLEVWAKHTDQYVLVKSYEICAMSGALGPKRKRGDFQVPEGFYVVRDFLKYSSYHLSLKINYPNASDKILKTYSDAGGDICIHGACGSIGCVAITDDLIKEVYWLAVLARSNGQTDIPVHIFPPASLTPNLPC